MPGTSRPVTNPGSPTRFASSYPPPGGVRVVLVKSRSTRLIAAVAAVALLAIVASTAWAATTKYPTVFTQFKLKTSSSGGKFKGQIDSTKGKCVNSRQVKLFRKHNGNKTKLGSDKTNSKGKFSIGVSGKLKNGSYYSKVSKKKYDNGKKVCEDVTSGKVKISS
jgi:5-hydroxyisourate hydrolase-like protein (transthyretin family)